MKLQQLKYLIAIVDNNLNITSAAEKVYTSQPGISKQLRLLEDELQLKIFERNGKQLVGVTPLGEEILSRSRKIIQEVQNIQRLTEHDNLKDTGSFSIATTQTQAQYVLPQVFLNFHKEYPNLKIDLQQGTTEQIVDLLKKQQVEFAIASGNEELGSDIVKIPCYQWDRIVLFPHDHELGDLTKITLKDITKYPIVTYPGNEKGDSSLIKACAKEKLNPNIVFTARDADIIKTYVKNGFGIGILASMAFEPQSNRNLISYSTRDILPRCTTWIAFNKNLFLRKYMKDFIRFFAPHISEEEFKHYLYQDHVSSLSLVNSIEPEKTSSLPMHNMWHI
ncbi:MAG: LysR family transcriptional regulator [Kangiellaceae bacterium]|nr:LysR family transcriptional regulator [Kangiellaceae bacterium]